MTLIKKAWRKKDAWWLDSPDGGYDDSRGGTLIWLELWKKRRLTLVVKREN